MAHTEDSSVTDWPKSNTDWRPVMINSKDNHPHAYQLKVSDRTLVGSLVPYHLNRPAHLKVPGDDDNGQEIVHFVWVDENIYVEIDTAEEAKNCSNRRFLFTFVPTQPFGGKRAFFDLNTPTTGATFKYTGGTTGFRYMTVNPKNTYLCIPCTVGSDGTFWIDIPEALLPANLSFA